MSVGITEEVESKALNQRDADVDEDEDYKKWWRVWRWRLWVIAVFNKLSLVSDQIYI